MACIFLISWSFWWRSIIVSGSSYSLSVGAMLSLRKNLNESQRQKLSSDLFEDILFRSMLVSPTAIPFRDLKSFKTSRHWSERFAKCIFRPGPSALQDMLDDNSRNERHASHPSDPWNQPIKFQTLFNTNISSFYDNLSWHLHVSLDQKSFEEDKVTVLCILNIHHSPGILKRKTISRKWKLTNSLPRILEKHYAFFLHFFFTCLPLTFLPPMSRTVLAPT